jgi:hypothetical protein
MCTRIGCDLDSFGNCHLLVYKMKRIRNCREPSKARVTGSAPPARVTCALPFCYKYSRLGSPLTIPAAAQRSKRKHAAVSDFPLLIPSSLSAMAMRAQVSGLLLLLLLLPLAPAPSRAATPARSSSSTAVFQLHGDVYPTGYPSSLPSILADQGRLVSGIRRESRPRWVPVLAIEFDAKVVFFFGRGGSCCVFLFLLAYASGRLRWAATVGLGRGVGPIPPAAFTNFLFSFPFSFRVHIVAGLISS